MTVLADTTLRQYDTPLSEANPARFEPVLANNLGILGRLLLLLKQYSLSIKAFEEGADLVRPYTKKMPQSTFARLLSSLESDLKRAQAQLK